MSKKTTASNEKAALLQPISTTSEASSPERRWRIWEAVLDLPGWEPWPPYGYLITEADDVDKVIAFAVCTSERDYKQAYRIARAFVADPASGGVMDLRPYLEWDSPSPMPEFVYALTCRPVDEFADADPDLDGLTPAPFCHRRFYRMLTYAAAEQWSQKERHDYPAVTIGIVGNGSGLDVEINPPGR